MLSQEELNEYVRRAKLGDEKAKETVLQVNTGLIKSIIKRFYNKGVEYDDLYQIACIGFLKAIINFNEQFNVKFSTYAVPMVIGEIKRYIRDNGAIKVSRNLKILANKINKFIFDYQSKNVDSPSIELIAQKFNVTCEEVVMAIDSLKMPVSIHEKYDDDEGLELIDKLQHSFDEEKMINKIHVSCVLEKLNEREKKIIYLRYFRDRTQGEIAKSMGVSQVQISRLESKIISKLKTNI